MILRINLLAVMLGLAFGFSATQTAVSEFRAAVFLTVIFGLLGVPLYPTVRKDKDRMARVFMVYAMIASVAASAIILGSWVAYLFF